MTKFKQLKNDAVRKALTAITAEKKKKKQAEIEAQKQKAAKEKALKDLKMLLLQQVD